MQEWIPDSVWLNLLAMSSIDSLRDMPDSVIKDEPAWKAWYDQEAPERSDIPGYEGRLSKFDKMCVVKVGASFFASSGPELSYLRFLFVSWQIQAMFQDCLIRPGTSIVSMLLNN